MSDWGSSDSNSDELLPEIAPSSPDRAQGPGVVEDDEGWSGSASARSRSRSRPGAASQALSSDDEEDRRQGIARVRLLVGGGPVVAQPVAPEGCGWWLNPLWKSLEHIRQSLPRESRPLRVVSVCTGLGAEAMIFDALDIPYEVICACDLKKGSIKFVAANFPKVKHFFASIECVAERKGFCLIHGRDCDLSAEGRADIVVGGPPCQPFTRFREHSDRTARTAANAKDHPDWEVTFKFLPRVLAVWKPWFALVEQVMGFDGQGDVENRSQLVIFCQQMMKQFSAVRVMELHNSDWIDVNRDRPRISIARYCIATLLPTKKITHAHTHHQLIVVLHVQRCTTAVVSDGVFNFGVHAGVCVAMHRCW